MKELNVLIVDDHEMIRDGLRYMLESEESSNNFKIDDANDGESGIDKALSNFYDIILMDYQLPDIDGAEAVKRIVNKKPGTKILALSNYDEYAYITNMMESGAKGFILKNVTPTELQKAIETVLNGKNYFSNEVALKLMQPHYSNVIATKPKKLKTSAQVKQLLSERELQILALVAKEFTNEEIAGQLNISKRTVDTHRNNLIRKVGVKNTVGLVKFAIKHKVI